MHKKITTERYIALLRLRAVELELFSLYLMDCIFDHSQEVQRQTKKIVDFEIRKAKGTHGQ